MKARGLTLVEMAIVLAIIGAALLVILPLSSDMRDADKRLTVRTTLTAIDAALVTFVELNHRLPCPADGTIVSGLPNAGVETLSAGPPPAAAAPLDTCGPASQLHGVVPWVTLGIPESAVTDPWNALITYRVYPPLAFKAAAAGVNPIAPVTATQNGIMDMSACDPAGTWTTLPTPVPITGACGGFSAAQGCTQCAAAVGNSCSTVPAGSLANCVAPGLYLANKGLPVTDGSGNWLNNPASATGAGNGAAYVLISAGPSGTGAYNLTGTLQPGSIVAGTNEVFNENGRALMTGSSVAQSYRDAPLNDVHTGANAIFHFDDYLSHPTILTVLQNANLAPRSH